MMLLPPRAGRPKGGESILELESKTLEVTKVRVRRIVQYTRTSTLAFSGANRLGLYYEVAEAVLARFSCDHAPTGLSNSCASIALRQSEGIGPLRRAGQEWFPRSKRPGGQKKTSVLLICFQHFGLLK